MNIARMLISFEKLSQLGDNRIRHLMHNSHCAAGIERRGGDPREFGDWPSEDYRIYAAAINMFLREVEQYLKEQKRHIYEDDFTN